MTIDTTTTAGESESKRPDPVVVELGTRGKGQLRKLRQGRGRLLRDIDDVVADLQQSGEVAADAQVVIVVVKQRPEAQDDCWWR
jgi:hypothetical protein